MTIEALEEMEQLAERAKAIQARADQEGRRLTDGERAEMEDIYARHCAADLAAAKAARGAAGQGTGRQSSPTPTNGRRLRPGDAVNGPEVAGGAVSHDFAARGITTPGIAARTVQAMFGEHVAKDRSGFRDSGEYLRAALSGRYDPRLQPSNLQQEGDGPGGGYAVVPQLQIAVLDGALEQEIVRPLATVHPMIGPALEVVAPDGSDHSAGSIYGFTVTWTGEGIDPGEQTGKVRKLTLNAHKVFVRGRASNELLQDAPGAVQAVIDGARQATAWGMDSAFIRGTGGGQPLGILNDPALIVVPKASGQAADSITWENLAACWARLHPASHRRAVWLAHPTTLPQLLKVHVPIEDASSAIVGGTGPIVATGPDGGYLLLGRPLLLTEHCNPVGDKGDVVLVDPLHYHVGLRLGLILQTSIHAGWNDDTTHFRLIARVAGAGGWAQPMRLLDGSTVSWATCIAERG